MGVDDVEIIMQLLGKLIGGRGKSGKYIYFCFLFSLFLGARAYIKSSRFKFVLNTKKSSLKLLYAIQNEIFESNSKTIFELKDKKQKKLYKNIKNDLRILYGLIFVLFINSMCLILPLLTPSCGQWLRLSRLLDTKLCIRCQWQHDQWQRPYSRLWSFR